MSISVRKDPNKINSVAGTFEKYIDQGKSVEFITEALQKKDYSAAEIQEGYELYLKSKNSNTTSIIFIGVALVAIGILGWKYYKANFMKEPAPIEVAEQPKFVNNIPTPTPTEIPKISMFDDQNHDDVQVLFNTIMKTLEDEYCEEEACEPTEEEAAFETRTRLLRLEGVTEKAKTAYEKAKRKLIVMTDPIQIKTTEEEIAQLKSEYEKAAAQSSPEKVKADAIASLRKRKFREFIYKDYEGMVVMRSFGPDPIGAYANAVKFYKTNERVQFFEPQFEARFWKLFQPQARDRVMQQDSYDF